MTDGGCPVSLMSNLRLGSTILLALCILALLEIMGLFKRGFGESIFQAKGLASLAF